MTHPTTHWTPLQRPDLTDDDHDQGDHDQGAGARTFAAGSAREAAAAVPAAAVELTREVMWAAQMRDQLARFGLASDCSVAALVAVAQGAVPPGAAVDGAVRAEVERLRARLAAVEALTHGEWEFNVVTVGRIKAALASEPAVDAGDREVQPSIGDTCCGRCPGGTCYVDQVTGESSSEVQP